MMSFLAGLAVGSAIVGVAFKGELATRYFLPPMATLLFLHALGVVEQGPHWAITTVEMIVAVVATLVSLVMWLVKYELWNAAR